MKQEEQHEYSKLLSYILRHDPAHAELVPEQAGWVAVDKLLEGLRKLGKPLSREDLEKIVAGSDKQRFAFSEDGGRIRSNQGHSIKVELGYQSAEPPDVLYHGTATRFVEAITREGLTRQSRHHVHLSPSIETASNVGKRHGKLVVLIIKAGLMKQSGFEFFLSTNGVWLTEHVPAQFIEFPD